MAIEVTDEMRRAVYADDCKRLGHEIDARNALRFGTTSGYGPELAGPDTATLPHLVCARCGKTWLVAEEPGDDYADAEQKHRARLRDEEKAAFDQRASARRRDQKTPPTA